MKSFGQFSRFLVVGVLNTGVDLVVLNAETLLTGVKEGGGYALQKGISFCVAVTCSYFLNKHWTFGVPRTDERKGRFSRFFVVSVMGAAINIAVATFVATYVKPMAVPFIGAGLLADQAWVTISAVCGSGAAFLWNFFGYKHVVFKP